MRNMYKACNFYMLRTPLLSTEVYKSISNGSKYEIEKKLEELVNIGNIKEAIQIASIDLFQNINKFDSDIYSTLLKYLIRGTTRTTPYGLFSGVSIGSFSDKSNIIIMPMDTFRKRMRVDMEWLYGVIDIIQNHSEYFDDLKVKFNEIVYKKGNRLINPYVSNLGLIDKKDGDIVSSIRETKLINIVRENTKDYISISKLVRILKKTYNNIDDNKIYSYIGNLIKNDYLISELRPTLIEHDPLEDLLNKLKTYSNKSKIFIELKKIKLQIDIYNKTLIGDGSSLYTEILNSMKEIYNECKNYLQVDSSINTLENKLNICISSEVENYCNMLHRIGISKIENISLKQYKEEFIEKYGVNIEIPILELLDEDIGLGAPSGYMTPRSKRNIDYDISIEKMKKAKDYIKSKIIESECKGLNSIELREEDIEKIAEDNQISELEEMSPSLEFNIIISAERCEDIDNQDYLLFIGPNIGSSKAGKTFGRFMDILEKGDSKTIKENIYALESKIINEEYIMVEINEILQHGRGNNLTINSSNVEYEVCIGTNPSGMKKVIDINDLYVGVSDNKFYIKSKVHNKKIYFTFHHMMNYLNGSNIGRFMKDVTFGYYDGLIDTAMLFDFKELEYVPRIKYGHIIIKPRTWNIKKEFFDLKNIEEFEKNLSDWIIKNRLPRYIYQKVQDNRLLIDLNNLVHRKELFNIIRKSDDIITLTETELGENLSRLIVKDINSNKYCSEIIVPLVREVGRKKYRKENFSTVIETKSIISQNKSRIGIRDRKRVLLFGNEGWYYYKIYIPNNRADEFIVDYLKEFIEKMLIDKNIDKYFFIRYADPDFHIRLRFRVSNKKNTTIFKYFDEFINNLYDLGLLNSIQSVEYFREIERYGGLELIDKFENYFFFDSLYVANLLQLKKEKKIPYTDIEIGIMTIIYIMEQFGLSFEQQAVFVKRVVV